MTTTNRQAQLILARKRAAEAAELDAAEQRLTDKLDRGVTGIVSDVDRIQAAIARRYNDGTFTPEREG
ncbi:hypothetical protein [Herbiconiux daphne]|uniref:Antitoxin VbhA domain-containing protein n=1 Tax=Herbiconiux daphne TaxID=2970914 RepID=A0ABT2H6E0_9MICO|nr:hypothetical protein [Herbiconiux daphne]MCS5735520.1 hypothetical protein [Herbiconiux daphne]